MAANSNLANDGDAQNLSLKRPTLGRRRAGTNNIGDNPPPTAGDDEDYEGYDFDVLDYGDDENENTNYPELADAPAAGGAVPSVPPPKQSPPAIPPSVEAAKRSSVMDIDPLLKHLNSARQPSLKYSKISSSPTVTPGVIGAVGSPSASIANLESTPIPATNVGRTNTVHQPLDLESLLRDLDASMNIIGEPTPNPKPTRSATMPSHSHTTAPPPAIPPPSAPVVAAPAPATAGAGEGSQFYTVAQLTSVQGSHYGYLEKLSSSRMFQGKSWKRRFFILADHALFLFRSFAPNEMPLTVLPFGGDGTTRVRVLTPGMDGVDLAGATWVVEVKVELEGGAVAELGAESQERTWVLAAADEDDMVSWLEAIRNAIDEVNGVAPFVGVAPTSQSRVASAQHTPAGSVVSMGAKSQLSSNAAPSINGTYGVPHQMLQDARAYSEVGTASVVGGGVHSSAQQQQQQQLAAMYAAMSAANNPLPPPPSYENGINAMLGQQQQQPMMGMNPYLPASIEGMDQSQLQAQIETLHMLQRQQMEQQRVLQEEFQRQLMMQPMQLPYGQQPPLPPNFQPYHDTKPQPLSVSLPHQPHHQSHPGSLPYTAPSTLSSPPLSSASHHHHNGHNNHHGHSGTAPSPYTASSLPTPSTASDSGSIRGGVAGSTVSGGASSGGKKGLFGLGGGNSVTAEEKKRAKEERKRAKEEEERIRTEALVAASKAISEEAEKARKGSAAASGDAASGGAKIKRAKSGKVGMMTIDMDMF
ncbi:hypothetical protein HK101_010014 [Irineochytrium annulatum]|nr:hypothetical protein HK101_010014 [Irineochytrium annulatum]